MNDPAIKRQENNSPLPDSENAAIARETQEDTKFRRSQASKHNSQNKSHKRGGSTNSETRELILSAIKNRSFEKLPQRGKDLLTLRYLQTGKPLTLDEIGKKMSGISRQRVHELEKTALDYLQGNKTTLEQLLGGNPKQVLEDLHSKQGLSQKDIADRFHKHPTTVSIWFKRFGISATTNRERRLEQLKQLLGGDPKEVLEDLSIKQGLSMTDIANRFHKTPSTVSQWFKRFDIRIPPRLVRQYILREKSVKLNK
ncbi:MAG TPA: sigma factor-like helix-turn-helix DNA-binding protein [Methylomirabilota bacterium]|nr:sigma factor-like helix-turn-helix DNA-binding protein [Methylomirabilota bacterium]